MRRVGCRIGVVLVLGGFSASAQMTDSLPELRVREAKAAAGDSRIARFAPGQTVVTVDSATLARYRRESVAALLSQQLPLFVKTYGTNGPATLNFRGASAAQSVVLWDGVPLQNAALGLTDLALLPVSFADGIQVVYGGSAALLGSGNVGGALLLSTGVPRFDTAGRRTLEVALGGGSFGRLQAFAGGTRADRRSAYSWRATGERAENNFWYQPDIGAAERLPNAQLVTGGIQATARYLRRSGVWGGAAWVQAADRHIPPAQSESGSVKRQQDLSIRLRGDWERQLARTRWSAKIAYLHDELRYDDAAARLHSDLAVHKVFGEAAWQRVAGPWQVLVFLPVQLSGMPLANGTLATQTSVATAASVTRSFWNRRLTAAANLRGESIDDQRIMLPGLNASFRVLPAVSLRANVQRTYRAPTLNERYFQPGGNPALRPEQGWGADVGAHLEGTRGAWHWSGDATAFTRRIHDWIAWFGGAIWTPHNIAVVQSSGGEGAGSLSWSVRGWQLGVQGSASYVDARTVESLAPGDGSIGKQIPYTPRWNGRTGASLSRGAWAATWSLAYTGMRYGNADESLPVSSYAIQYASVGYQRVFGRQTLGLLLRCDNLTDARYAVVYQRPAPGRSYSLTLSFRHPD